jgi:hypothetical protein
VTGKPIYGVEERPAPQSEVPLERASKTQPFPLKPLPLSQMTMSPGDIAAMTPERDLLQETNRGRAAGRALPSGRLQSLAGAVPRKPRRRQLGWRGVRSLAWLFIPQHERAWADAGVPRPARINNEC